MKQKKNTLMRKFKAWMLWQDRFWMRPENKDMFLLMQDNRLWNPFGFWL